MKVSDATSGVNTYRQCFKITFCRGRWAVDCLLGLVTFLPFQVQLCALANACTNREITEDKDSVQCHQDVPEWWHFTAHHLPLHQVVSVSQQLERWWCTCTRTTEKTPESSQWLLAISPLQSTTDLKKNNAFWGNHGHTYFIVLPITQKKMQKQCNRYLCLGFQLH